MDAPFTASRASSDVVLAVGVAMAVAGLMVTAVEGVIARRRTLAALAVSGTPRRVLGEAVLSELRAAA